jgi:hypothetical protein
VSGKLLVDNWTLQNAGELLHGQRRGEMAQELAITESAEVVRYHEVPRDVVALACLCQVLEDVIFANHIVVDAAFTDRWSDLPALARLTEANLVEARAFHEFQDRWVAEREAIVADLAAGTPAIRQQHEQNLREYAAHGRSPDPMLAQVLAGTAGMLARAQMCGLPYIPHPLRERLLLKTQFPSPIGGARRALVRFIDSQQVKLYRSIDDEGIFGSLRLPPVVVQVIEEASTLSEVIPVALELRQSYAELRDWLAEFQRALDFEDVREVLARKKILLSVSDYLDHFSSRQSAGVTSVQISTDLQPKATLDARGLVNRAINRFGVRAQINRLVLIGPGRRAFHKFLHLLGESRSNREGSLERSFYAFLARF